MYKILLADDVRLSLVSEKDYLEGRNLKVFATTSALEALDLAGIVQPDLVVLDYEMPEMTGAEVCERIRKDPRTAHIPVLIVTAHDGTEIAAICRQAGSASFVRKSEGRERLLEEVARILGVPRRKDLRAPCEFTAGIARRGKAFSGFVENLSETGMFLTAQCSFEKGMALRLTFDLPSQEQPVRILGEVVRVEEMTPSSWGFGIQFLEVDSESREVLRIYLASTV